MKIAYLLSEYPTLGHTYFLREVKELRALGWKIQTISVRKPADQEYKLSPAEYEERASTWYVLGSSPREILNAHLATFLTRPIRYLDGLLAAWRSGRLHLRLTALATAYFIEAVYAGHRLRKAGITHVHCAFATTVALLLGRVFDIGLSMTIHGPADLVDPEGFQLAEKVRASKFVSGISYFGKSQIMLYSSPRDWHKLEVTPLGIDIARWRPAIFRENPAPFELISVGRLEKVKGYPLLLDAFAALVAQARNVRLTVVGDGPDRSGLEKQARQLGIADRVTFAGWRTQEELRKLYQNSDLCVLFSFAEGIPVVLMEAMASGVPCVAPLIAGIPELIRDHIEGLLVTPSDTKELVTAIAEVMDRPGLRRQMAKLCRERITAKYELRKNTLHLSEVFTRWVRNVNERRLEKKLDDGFRSSGESHDGSHGLESSTTVCL